MGQKRLLPPLRRVKPPARDDTAPSRIEAVTRRCEVCEWQSEVIQTMDAEPDCPWCHAPTVRVATLAAPIDLAHDTSIKNPHAAALGRLGGAKGGRARARALTAAERRRIATRAARARWAGTRTKKR